jgi:hypothetical protein
MTNDDKAAAPFTAVHGWPGARNTAFTGERHSACTAQESSPPQPDGKRNAMNRLRSTLAFAALAAAALAAALATPQAHAARERTVKSGVNADGSASRQRSFSATGSRGSVNSSGTATRDASGNVTGSRNTTATNAATGNSAQASTTYTRDANGFSADRSVTCYNASGATVACR